MRSVTALVVFTSMLALVPRARADEPRPTAVLEYERAAGAESCPSEPSLRRSVAAHLGYDPFVEQAELHVVARIVATRRGLVGTVEAVDGGAGVGRREIPSPTADCVELARALALAISVAVDPFSLTRGDAPPPDPDPDPDPPVSPPPETEPSVELPPVDPPEPEVSPPVARSRDDHAAVGPVFALGAGLGIGSVPRVRPLLFGQVGYDLARVGLRLDLRLDMPAQVSGEVSGSATAFAYAARAYACARVSSFAPCAGVGVSMLRARGADLDTTKRATSVSPLLSAAVFVRVPTQGRCGVALGLGLDVPVVRPRLRLQLEPAWTMPPVLGFFSVAMHVRP